MAGGVEMNRPRAKLMPEEAASMPAAAAASFAALAQQVATLEGDYNDLKSTLVGIDRKFTETLGSLSTKFDTAIAGLSTKIEERGKTQWPTLIAAGMFFLAVTGAIGAMAYRPIDATTARHEEWITYFEKRYVEGLQEQNRMLRNELNARRP